MSVRAVELRRVAMPLVEPFRAAHGVEDVRDVLLVRVETDDGEGWGECAALRDDAYSGEDVESAHVALRDDLAPGLLAIGELGGAGATPMARAALEMAVLDADLRARGVSLASSLGATRARVPAGVAVGLQPTIDDLVSAVERYAAEGYVRAKLKIEPGNDVASVRAVRAALPDLALQVDANGAYSRADVDVMRALDDLALVLIEQPFAQDDLDSHAWLRTHVQMAVCLDESLVSVDRAIEAFELGACDVACIKPGRLGGISEAVRLHDECVGRGVAAWCGGMLETGIGRAANLALAALPGFTLVGDLSASARYYERDLITPPIVLDDGAIAVPTGPGLGVEVDRDAVDDVTTRVDRIGARG